MLTFFRKYQKLFFIFTTVIIVLSFTLFGMVGSMQSTPEVKEVPLVKAIDGSTVTVQKVDRMARFLSSSHLDLRDDRIGSVNLLNHGFLEEQFLETSLGRALAEKIMPEIEKDMTRAVERSTSFQTYRYPGAPFLSSESVWGQFAPESMKIAGELMTHGASLSALRKFDLLSQGYLQHQRVPSGFIRKILNYQAQQVAHVEQDPSLSFVDVSLLGLHSAKDWLGESYIRAASQVIINGAALARRQGYSVSTQDAREMLVLNVRKAAEMVGQEVSPQTNFYQIFLNQTRNLGLNEPECLDLWKDIVLFQKLFDKDINVKDIPQLETLSADQALVEKFSLGSELQFRDFLTLMKLQMYVDAVSANKKRSKEGFFLPTEFLSVAEVEKKAPDLVQRDYVLEYAEVSVSKIASQIGLKETWNYQTQEEGWNALKKQYPALATSQASTKEDRFKALDAVDSKLRAEMDKFSRLQILLKDKGRIQKELELAKVETRSFGVSSKGLELPFKGIKDSQGLAALLEAAPLKGSLDAIQEKLGFYTGDEEHYYKISVVERSPLKRIQTFAEANSSGSLRRLLDKKLEDAYVEVRKKDPTPYVKKDGTWKSFTDVKDKIGMAVFASTLKTIGAEYQAVFGREASKEELESPKFYVENWMLSHMKEALAKVSSGSEVEQNPLASQWKVSSQNETLVKKEHVGLVAEDFVEGSWSSLVRLSSGKVCFFKTLQKLEAAAPTPEEIAKLSAPMKRSAEKKLFEQLFAEIETKKAISFKAVL